MSEDPFAADIHAIEANSSGFKELESLARNCKHAIEESTDILRVNWNQPGQISEQMRQIYERPMAVLGLTLDDFGKVLDGTSVKLNNLSKAFNALNDDATNQASSGGGETSGHV